MISAYILGKVEPNSETQIPVALKKIKGVKSAEITFGQYDFVAHVEAENEIRLKDTIVEKVRILPGIVNTTTLIVSKMA